MFFGTFAWSFVSVSLPFHIRRLSPWDAAATLRWTGWIRYYVLVQFLQGAAFFAMAAARTLPQLLLTRLVLGVMGAASTFAFISAGRADNPVAVRRQVAAMQSAMTVGGVIGPLSGAIAAARLGFAESFVIGGLVLFGCGVLVHRGVPDTGARRRPRRPTGPAGGGRPPWCR